MKLSCFTDEISQDLAHALDVMREYEVEGAELRGLWDKNISALTDAEAKKAKKLLDAKGTACSCIGSPLLKCELYPPGGGEDEPAQIREQQLAMLQRCIRMAEIFGTDVIRVFSFWKRGEMIAEVEDAIPAALLEMAEIAGKSGKIIALEGEPTCYVRTSEEIALILRRINLPNMMAAWDPSNGFCVGEELPYPDGYELLKGRIAHIHIKDCLRTLNRGTPLVVIGEGEIDYKGLFAALIRDGYDGYVSLETHYTPLGGTPEQGTRLFLTGLKYLLDNARVTLQGGE